MLALVVGGVALFGIGCYLGVHWVLIEVESERVELKDCRYGRWL